jgi:hypothetical protein
MSPNKDAGILHGQLDTLKAQQIRYVRRQTITRVAPFCLSSRRDSKVLLNQSFARSRLLSESASIGFRMQTFSLTNRAT